MKRVRVGEFFPDAELYASEANKTAGQPAIGPQFAKVIINRRAADGALTAEGVVVYQRVIDLFKDKFNLHVRLSFNRNAGCTMCACSPGFIIMADNDGRFDRRLRSESRRCDGEKVTIWTKANGSLDVRLPKFGQMSQMGVPS